MPLLDVESLEVAHGDLLAVAGVSLVLPAGGALAVIGANGAGKSTLLRAIAGLHPARAGRVLLDDEDITRLRADQVARRGIALVPEGRRLFASLSARENLHMGALTGRRGPWDEAAVLDLFPAMRDFLDRLPGQISGGQAQMVAIGRALMSNPRVLLCDEISLGLAPKVIDELYRGLARVRANGIAVLLVEQDLVRARAAADHVLCLLEGRVSLAGPARSLDPADIADAYFGTHHGMA